MKNMLKNKQGFTLVELITVIIILMVILFIAIPTIGDTIKTSKDKYYSSLESMLKTAAKEYFKDNQNETIEFVTLETLISNNNIEPLYNINKKPCDKIKSKVEKKDNNLIVKLICPDYETLLQ